MYCLIVTQDSHQQDVQGLSTCVEIFGSANGRRGSLNEIELKRCTIQMLHRDATAAKAVMNDEAVHIRNRRAEVIAGPEGGRDGCEPYDEQYNEGCEIRPWCVSSVPSLQPSRLDEVYWEKEKANQECYNRLRNALDSAE